MAFKRKTIVYVGGFEVPDGNTAALRVLANGKALRELGYRVVFIGVSKDADATDPPERQEYADGEFEYWNLPYPKSQLEWLGRMISISAVEGIIRQNYAPDLAAIISYDMPAVVQQKLKSLAHALGAKGLAEITEWYGSSRMSSVRSIVKNIDTFLRMRVVNLDMDGLIVASSYLDEYYSARGSLTTPLPTLMFDYSSLENGHDARPEPAPVRLFFGATGFDPKIVRTMRDGPKDRLDKVIEALDAALAAGSDFRLDIVGVDKASYLLIVPDHREVLDRIGDRIVFHGQVDRLSARRMLATADYSIFLRANTISTVAGFPTKYAESIHAGTPVITNAIGSLVAYHEEGRTGHFIDYDDVELAGRQLAAILDTPRARVQAMKDHCLSSGLFHYSNHAQSLGNFLDLCL